MDQTHISESRFTEIIVNEALLSREELEHMMTCSLCLESLREAVRKSLSAEK